MQRSRTAAPPPLFHQADVQAPHALLMLLEGRAPWEYAAMLAALPWLKRLPHGDGHPVIVFPGLGATDITTAPLRGLLQDLGYSAYPWKQGFNFGPRRGVLDAVREHVQRIAERHGKTSCGYRTAAGRGRHRFTSCGGGATSRTNLARSARHFAASTLSPLASAWRRSSFANRSLSFSAAASYSARSQCNLSVAT